jgi:serine/threonine-protein kinase ULK/ATG1
MTPIDRSTTIVRASNSGLMDDDSMLGRDYVVVEKRTVEINALADGSSRPLL